MTAFVRRRDVQSRRQAEPDAADERVREAHAGKIDVGVLCQKRTGIFMRRQELCDGVGKRRRLARDDILRCLSS